MKYQIYLSISEMQPTFKLRSRLKLVQTDRVKLAKVSATERTKSERKTKSRKYLPSLLSTYAKKS